jgi:hypothetical protein
VRYQARYRRGGLAAQADIAGLIVIATAFFNAIGDVVHQRFRKRGQRRTGRQYRDCSSSCCTISDRGWAGPVPAGGFALQAAALGMESVLLVQALLVGSLVFAGVVGQRRDCHHGFRRQ